MARWACAACGALWAAGAPCCPACRGLEHTEEDGVPKILPDGTVTYEPGREPPGTAVEHPADGTLSPPVSNEPAPGQPPGAGVTREPVPAPEPEPAPAPEPAPEPAPAPAPKPAPARAPKKAPGA